MEVPWVSKINMATIEMPIVIKRIHKLQKHREVDSDEILLPTLVFLTFSARQPQEYLMLQVAKVTLF